MNKKDSPQNYPTVPILIGKEVYLRVMEAADNELTYLWFLQSDPQSQTCHLPILATPQEARERASKRERNPERGEFVIVRKEDDRPVGKISYHGLNMLSRSAELGYTVAPDMRQKGYAKEGLRLLIRYLFTYFGLNRIYAQTGAFNEPSIRLLKSLDFQLEGTLRQHHYYRGNLHDDLIFSLLKFECGFLGD